MTDADRNRISGGLWFLGSLMWALAAATILALLGLLIMASEQNQAIQWSWFGWAAGATIFGVVSGYVLKGLALLVEKPE